MIGDAHVPEESVVRNDALAKLDDAWFVLVVEVTFHEALAEFDDLSESEVLPGDTVQSTSRLNDLRASASALCLQADNRYQCRAASTHLHGLPVRSSESNRPQPIVHLLQQLSASLPLLRSALFVHVHKLLVDGDRRAKLDDCARAELVWVEVGQTDGDEFHVEVWVGGHCAECHDGETGFEGEEVGPIVRAA